MSASIASAPWSTPSSASPWRSGLPWVRQEDATGVRWILRRNCALTPAQLMRAFLALCGLSLAIALGFAAQGAPVVLVFSLIELTAVGLALVVYARHVCDGDTLTLRDRLLCVEQTQGGRSSVTTFRAEWVTVEPSGARGSLVELSGQGQLVCVGRTVIPHMRANLAQELRQALRLACQPFSESSD